MAPKPGNALPTDGPITTRLLTLEAMGWLCLARLLIGFMRFERWRHWLGSTAHAPTPVSTSVLDSVSATVFASDNAAPRMAHYLARVIERANNHLPRPVKCLPQAMALHWMLHRRNFATQIVIAALPAGYRKGRDDLHAWVETSGEILIGESDLPHRPMVRFEFPAATAKNS